jgi:hypothetical protein
MAALGARLVAALFLVALGGPGLRAAAAAQGLVVMAVVAMRLAPRVLVGPASRWL